MGTIIVKGNAKKSVTADSMCLSITIRSKENTTARALEKVRNECESLLELLNNEGLDLSKVIIENDSVEERSRYDSKDVFMVGKKHLEINLKADVKAANAIMGIIEKCNYDIEANVRYSVEDTSAVYKELIKDAVLDSKAKAETIAEALGEEVVGAKEISNDAYSNRRHITDAYDRLDIPCFLTREKSETPLTDTLGLPEREYSEEVVVEWITE